ncbi:MAG: LapA family protein [Nitrospiraceae bacterium]|nr:MAG: LapA family protein [Nitrospiraceae bacterium]
MQLFLFLAFVIAVLFVIIAFQNPGDISLIFVNREMSAPTALMLAVPFAAGLIAGLFLFVPLWWKKSKLARANKKRVMELEEEITKIQDQIEEVKPADEETPEEEENQENSKGPGDIF